MFAADVHALVLNGVDDSLSRNCCCFKFQQSWNWTKQVLHFGSVCGKGKSNVTRDEIKFHVFRCLPKEMRGAGSVVNDIECLQWGQKSPSCHFIMEHNGCWRKRSNC